MRPPPPEGLAALRLPIPSGWYCVTASAALRRDDLLATPFCGRDLAVWRTRSGRARAAWNVCPHLGGRLAPTGKVEGDSVVCGLHRRRYDIEGRGRHGACLTMVPVREQNGLVLAWFHPDGAQPTWEVPRVDEAGWSPPVFHSVDLPTSPHHVMQDLADLTHFETIHRYRDLVALTPVRFDGAGMQLVVRFGWDTGLPVVETLPATFASRCHGLGYQVTEVDTPGGLTRSRHFVLPTPLDRATTRVHLGLSVRFVGPAARVLDRVARPVRVAAERGFRTFMDRMYRRDVARDARLWTERYHLDDTLPAPDPEIRAYRVWAAQFYPPVPPDATAS